MDERRPINIQTATDAQLKSIDGIYQSKSRRLIKKRDEKGILLKKILWNAQVYQWKMLKS